MRYKLLAVSAVVAGAMLGCNENMVSNEPVVIKVPGMDTHGGMLGNTCSGCHGPQGNSFGPAIPSIAGISKDYFVEKMTAYKEGDAYASIMGNIAKGYSEKEIEAMSTYFNQQTYIPREQEHDASLAAKGKVLHEEHCQKCHENSPEDESGFLSGQWMLYLEYALNDYQSGKADAPKKMAKKLKTVTEEHGADGIKQLIHYYGSAK